MAKKNTNLTVKQDPAGINIQLKPVAKSTYKKELSTFLSAVQSANNLDTPNRKRLYEHYVDMQRDPVFYGHIQNRIMRIANKKFRIFDVNTGKTDEDKSKLLEKNWFNVFLKLAMESRFFGHSLIYFSEFKENLISQVECVIREHVVPEKGFIVVNPGDTKGISYLDGDIANYCISVGNKKDLGLNEKLIIPFILKKHSWAAIDQYEELYGIPIRTATTTSPDTTVHNEIFDNLDKMGSAAYGLFPEGTTLEIVAASGAEGSRLFLNKIAACNQECAMLVNGQIETSTQTGSRAKSENVVESTQDEITLDDLMFCENLINDELLSKLAFFNYPFGEKDRFEFDSTKEPTIDEQLNIYKGVSDIAANMGYELDPVQIQETFGVTLVKKLAVEPLEPAEPEPPASSKQQSKKPAPGK